MHACPFMHSSPQLSLQGGKRHVEPELHPHGCHLGRIIKFSAHNSGAVKFNFHEMTNVPITVVTGHHYNCHILCQLSKAVRQTHIFKVNDPSNSRFLGSLPKAERVHEKSNL